MLIEIFKAVVCTWIGFVSGIITMQIIFRSAVKKNHIEIGGRLYLLFDLKDVVKIEEVNKNKEVNKNDRDM